MGRGPTRGGGLPVRRGEEHPPDEFSCFWQIRVGRICLQKVGYEWLDKPPLAACIVICGTHSHTHTHTHI